MIQGMAKASSSLLGLSVKPQVQLFDREETHLSV